MKSDFKKEIAFGEKVTAQLKGGFLKIKGPKGEVERNFSHPKVQVAMEDGKIVVSAHHATKKEKTIFGSFVAHIKNLVKGVQEPFVYKLKICSGHFPITVSVSGNKFIIKNFFGETIPREMDIPKGVEVKVAGAEITVSSSDIELAGQTASGIENTCRITKRDIRVFQDGCYITHKGGEK
jgi:large subunit ribosomal protein L6